MRRKDATPRGEVTARDILIGKGFDQTGTTLQVAKTSGLDFEVVVHGLKNAAHLNGLRGKVVNNSDVGDSDDAVLVDLGNHGRKMIKIANLQSADDDDATRDGAVDAVARISIPHLSPSVEYDVFAVPSTQDGKATADDVSQTAGTPLLPPPSIQRIVPKGSDAEGAEVAVALSGPGRVHVAVVPKGKTLDIEEFFDNKVATYTADSNGAVAVKVPAPQDAETGRPAQEFQAVMLSDVEGSGAADGYAVNPSTSMQSVDLRTAEPAPVIVSAEVTSTSLDGCDVAATVAGVTPGRLFWAVTEKGRVVPNAAFVTPQSAMRRGAGRRRGSSLVPGSAQLLANGEEDTQPMECDVEWSVESARLKSNTEYSLHLITTANSKDTVPDNAPHTLTFTTPMREGVPVGHINVKPGVRDANVSVASANGADGTVATRIVDKKTGQPLPNSTRHCILTAGNGGVAVKGLEPGTKYELQSVGISPDLEDAVVEKGGEPDWSKGLKSVDFATEHDGGVLAGIDVSDAETTQAKLTLKFARAGKVHYMVRPGAPKAIDVDDIVTWGSGVACGMDSGGAESVVLAKLAPGKEYTVAVVEPNEAPVLKTFSTKALPPPADVAEWVQVRPGEAAATAELFANRPGKVAWVCQPSDRPAPTAQDIAAWLKNPPAGCKVGVHAAKQPGSTEWSMNGLEPGADHALYVAATEDGRYGDVHGPEEFTTDKPKPEQGEFVVSEEDEEDEEEEEDAVEEAAGKPAEDTVDESYEEQDDAPTIPRRTFAEEERDPLKHFIDISCITQPQFLKAMFNVQKFNPDQPFAMASKRDRVWVLDFFDRTFANLAPLKTPEETLLAAKGKNAKQQSYKKLFRCEKDVANLRRVRMKFFSADHPYDLVFESSAHRQRFYECSKALRNGLVWAPSLCPDIKGPHCFSVQIKGETSAPICTSKTGRQHMDGAVEIKCSNVPCDETKLWVGCIDLQSVGGLQELDFNRWMPPQKHDIYVVGFVDIPPEYQGTSQLCDKLVCFAQCTLALSLPRPSLAPPPAPTHRPSTLEATTLRSSRRAPARQASARWR